MFLKAEKESMVCIDLTHRKNSEKNVGNTKVSQRIEINVVDHKIKGLFYPKQKVVYAAKNY